MNYSGLVIAGLGFFLTRFTVTLALYEDPVRFYLAGVVPLLLGLGLAAFGVALVVADVDPAMVRTTARWCVLGTGAMLVLVVLTLLGSTPGGVPDLEAVRSQAYLSNFLIGGSVGGTLTGLYAARDSQHHDELAQQANRLEVLNRMLRHEVLNSVNVIQGYAAFSHDDHPDAPEIISRRSNAIEETIEQVKYLTWSTKTKHTSWASVDLEACLQASVEIVRNQYPQATVTVDLPESGVTVRANERLERVFTELLENAVVHATGTEPAVEVTVTATNRTVSVDVHDDGTGLPEPQRALLETGEITEFDDPRDGYGLNIVRILVESFGGDLETRVTDDGTTVSVRLTRTDTQAVEITSSESGLAGVQPSVPHLSVVLGAAVLAGVLFAVVAEQLGGSVAAIGVFYGINDPVVGWLTHEFHSAVFGFVFAGLVSFVPLRYRDSVPAYTALGAAWGVCLWVVAAGLVAPIWLNLLGIPAPLPALTPVQFATHLVWGVSLGVLTALGYRHAVPRLARVTDRLSRTVDRVRSPAN